MCRACGENPRCGMHDRHAQRSMRLVNIARRIASSLRSALDLVAPNEPLAPVV
jgi:hypothetical protein